MKNDYIIKGDYVIIYLYNRNKDCFETLIDLEDLDKLLSFDVTWYPDYGIDTNSYYAKATQFLGTINGKPKYKLHFLQKYIFYSKSSGHKINVDHRDHNTLDNRKKNLRLTEHKENLRNRKSRNKNNKSGYRNVCLINTWYYIQLQINNTNCRFKERFKDVHKAGAFAREMREKYYGEFAGSG